MIKRPKNKLDCRNGKQEINCGNCKDFADCKGIKAQIKPYLNVERIKVIILVCAECNTECEVENLDDITTCGNCGGEVSKENAGAVLY